jgi:hypothetical protein
LLGEPRIQFCMTWLDTREWARLPRMW